MSECDCVASGNQLKPLQHGADPHAKNCNIYREPKATMAARIAALPRYDIDPVWGMEPIRDGNYFVAQDVLDILEGK